VEDASKALEDWHSLGQHIYDRGWILFRKGKLNKAEQLARESLLVMKRTSNAMNLAVPKRLLGLIALDQEQYDKAERLFYEALGAWQPYEDDPDVAYDIASVKTDLGTLAYRQGDYAVAQKWNEEVLAIGQRLEEPEVIAWISDHLGNIALKLRKLPEARQWYMDGFVAAQKAGRVPAIASCKQGLGQVAEAEGKYEEAAMLMAEAQTMYERLGVPKKVKETQAMMERLEGRIAEARKGQGAAEGNST